MVENLLTEVIARGYNEFIKATKQYTVADTNLSILAYHDFILTCQDNIIL